MVLHHSEALEGEKGGGPGHGKVEDRNRWKAVMARGTHLQGKLNLRET